MQPSTIGLLFGYVVALAAHGLGNGRSPQPDVGVARQCPIDGRVAIVARGNDSPKPNAGAGEAPAGEGDGTADANPVGDHFVPVTVTTMLAVTIFYWFFGFAIRGSFQTKPHGEQASGESTAPEITS